MPDRGPSNPSNSRNGPGCFIVSAATQGKDPEMLAHYRAGEAKLEEMNPGLHQQLRSFYNAHAPGIADMLNRHPNAATAAYVALKPGEWLAQAVVKYL